jgi:hypothetical protein
LRYSLPASAGLIAVAAALTIFSPADAADCGCRDAVQAALAKDGPVERAPARRAAIVETFYDYRAARAVNGPGYGHQWREAPQGYVAPVPAYDGPADLPPYAPMSYAPPGAPPAYAEGYGDGYAYGYRQGITVDQQGWIGGVGYAGPGGGGGGGGGGGLTLTLAQPDNLNGPSYNSFGQGYGGDYGAANQVGAWRTQAFTPPSNSGSGSGAK